MTEQRADDDCLVACLSYALGEPYEAIPQFVRDNGGMWLEAWKDWLREKGFEVVGFDNHYPREGLYLADGWTTREIAHMTVWRGCDLIHDPHESKSGLTNIRRTWWIMPLSLQPEN